MKSSTVPAQSNFKTSMLYGAKIQILVIFASLKLLLVGTVSCFLCL